jgi:Tfp pilus assembly protein PilX
MILIKQKHEMHCNKQHGFVLVMALVLLAVMTLIGVSSMERANMELRTMANAQHHHIAFTGGQSVLEYIISTGAIRSSDLLPLNFQDTTLIAQPVTTAVGGVNNTGSLAYVGCTVGVGSSLEEGKGLSYNFFNSLATGVNKSVLPKATSIQNQGIRFPAAACPKI